MLFAAQQRHELKTILSKAPLVITRIDRLSGGMHISAGSYALIDPRSGSTSVVVSFPNVELQSPAFLKKLLLLGETL